MWQIKSVIRLLFILVFLFGFSIIISDTVAAVQQPSELDEAQRIEYEAFDEVDQYWKNLMNEYGEYFPKGEAKTFIQMLEGNQADFQTKTVFKAVLSFFFHEIIINGKLLGSIIVLTILSMLLQTIQSAFEHPNVSKIAYTIVYIVLIVIAVQSFQVAITYAKDAISSMMHFMMAMIPLLLTLLASMGNMISVSVLHPVIVFMVHTVGTVVHGVVFPLIFFSAILHIVSSITDKYKVTQLANLLRTIALSVLSVMMTVFLGVIAVQGASSSVADGVTLRTAKFITGNFVPIVGNLFSDATDTVISASLLVKNAVGMVGVVIIIFLCAFPAMKILALALIYNLAGAIMQPLGDSPIIQCLQTIGRSLLYVFAALAIIGLMFFLAITIIIAASNVPIMMR